jgi:hypothetical protein
VRAAEAAEHDCIHALTWECAVTDTVQALQQEQQALQQQTSAVGHGIVKQACCK